MEVRIFLERVEIESGFISFLRFNERDLVSDVLGVVVENISDTSFRAYSVTQEVHGELMGHPRNEFLERFAPSAPEGFGPVLGAGIVFYFGEETDRLFSSLTLDSSRVVGEGIFVQSVVLYDASKVVAGDLQIMARSHFESLFDRIGLARAR